MANRIDIVNHAFEFLDAQRQGRLGLGYLSQVYNARNHPRVRTR